MQENEIGFLSDTIIKNEITVLTEDLENKIWNPKEKHGEEALWDLL